MTKGCDILMVAYGSSARIAKGALNCARAEGIKAGLFRPISLWPFPSERLAKLAKQVKGVLVVEMSSGQMIEDVKLAVGGEVPVFFEGRMGGGVPTVNDVLKAVRKIEFNCKRR
jgi:2-oxoglutarate ferredoxin oxidoreductase subunit alpha